MKENFNSILCEGQFVKENKPFKTTLNTLVGKSLTYRWDPLHLFNRAHIKARGNIYKHEVRPVSDSSTTVDHDDFDWDEILNLEDTTDTASVSQNADSDTKIVRQVIKDIQKEAKYQNVLI